ncbi:MAG: helix-turn-helix transcriptional regulator [Bacteroidales bacterium]|nr:helix-turn-helix domain-containing protein [Bacteroidales bacterium]
MKYRIKELCKDKGITFQDLAKRIGSSQASISRIASGSNTTTETLEKIAGVLGVSVNELFAESSNNNEVRCPYCGNTIKITKP